MSIAEKDKLFRTKYLSRSCDEFEATANWYKDANYLKSLSQNRLSNSEALNACLTGELPENLYKRIPMNLCEDNYASKFIRNKICEIDDVQVQNCVTWSLAQSRSIDNLTFYYNDQLTEYQKDRVEIICRIVWYTLYPMRRRNDG